jgi:hypothetical protein
MNPKLKNPNLKCPFSNVPDYRDILAITEGHNWKPVTRKGRFINANYPPKDVSQAELRRIWGNPDGIVPFRERRIKPKRKRKIEPSLV